MTKLDSYPGLPSVCDLGFGGFEGKVPVPSAPEASCRRPVLIGRRLECLDVATPKHATLTLARLIQGVPGTRLAQKPLPHPPEFGTVLVCRIRTCMLGGVYARTRWRSSSLQRVHTTCWSILSSIDFLPVRTWQSCRQVRLSGQPPP